MQQNPNVANLWARKLSFPLANYCATSTVHDTLRSSGIMFASRPIVANKIRSPVLHYYNHGSAVCCINGHATSTSSTVLGLSASGEPGVVDKELHLEASDSYLSYAMSVIVGRALPDVRDGLKPVHRRLLFAMHDLGLNSTKPFKKCARVVGEVLGKYHPHGDTAVYDALVRLAQDFSMRVPLISGHGNFGSLDDDPAAAMRYTECRLRHFTEDALLSDLDLSTVDFFPTFDASQEEPSVLPAKVPLLLVNGASGIAVGIATKIPPHNLIEVVNGLVAMIHNPGITCKELMQFIPAPDFPTGGIVMTGVSTEEAYMTGRGSVTVRAKVSIEYPHTTSSTKKYGRAKKGGVLSTTNNANTHHDPVVDALMIDKEAPGQLHDGGLELVAGEKNLSSRNGSIMLTSDSKQLLVITEMPFQTSKSEVVQRIAQLVEDKTLEGVADIRDESDREGLRVVVEVKKGHSGQAVLEQLYAFTKLQSRFAFNMVALKGSQPLNMGLIDILRHFLDFRCEVIVRRAQHQMARSLKRLHLVEGYLRAMDQMDDVVQAIRSAQSAAEARNELMQRFSLSEEQTEGVLGLTLRRLTALEKGALEQESRELSSRIHELQTLLLDKSLVLAEVEREALEVARLHGNPRRTAIEVEALSNINSRSTTSKRSSASASASGSSLDGGKRDALEAAVADAVAEEQREQESQRVSDRDCVLVLSKKGFLKRCSVGAALKGGAVFGFRTGDSVVDIHQAKEKDPVLLLTSTGRLYLITANQVPDIATGKSTLSSGTAAVQVLGLASSVNCVAMLPISAPTRMAMYSHERHVAESSLQAAAAAAAAAPGSRTHHVQPLSETPPSDEKSSTSSTGLEGDEGSRDVSESPLCLLMVTQNGTVKRMPLSSTFLKLGKGGAQVAKVDATDPICCASVVNSHDSVLLASSDGKLLSFPVTDVPIRDTRTSGGVKGMVVTSGERVVSMCVLKGRDGLSVNTHKTAEHKDLRPDDHALTAEQVMAPISPTTKSSSSELATSYQPSQILVVSSSGYAKRVDTSEFRSQHRGGKGIIVQARKRAASLNHSTSGNIMAQEARIHEADVEVEEVESERTNDEPLGSNDDGSRLKKKRASSLIGEGTTKGETGGQGLAAECLVAAHLVHEDDVLVVGASKAGAAAGAVELKVVEVPIMSRAARGVKVLPDAGSSTVIGGVAVIRSSSMTSA
ncbi:hypothetical protein CEUSTIGMA_g9257.t1 [Chlamydomonas eustigma]|uniref:DNA topoisomerase (ATP-hydrolyzing) n=1 Tax=Chlamydomonas eustigma TaxID=1157962 RepID=A0A250XFZ5_9CHLO|nr:hypothetical protein CEUSTIGMA_g9257.t1 [Chlamydomonas eustigma]|eukprot:GAX81829.1 hypothetical protein CEUSTIGMA_g9257.t1 [Chlamydomonas eustigma]